MAEAPTPTRRFELPPDEIQALRAGFEQLVALEAETLNRVVDHTVLEIDPSATPPSRSAMAEANEIEEEAATAMSEALIFLMSSVIVSEIVSFSEFMEVAESTGLLPDQPETVADLYRQHVLPRHQEIQDCALRGRSLSVLPVFRTAEVGIDVRHSDAGEGRVVTTPVAIVKLVTTETTTFFQAVPREIEALREQLSTVLDRLARSVK